MAMLMRAFLFALVKGTGAIVLGGTILWQVAAHSAPRQGQAIVHVTALDVEVAIDEAAYRVATLRDSPIVCPLGPGHHRLQLTGRGRILFEQEFTLDPGEEIILAAWERTSGN